MFFFDFFFDLFLLIYFYFFFFSVCFVCLQTNITEHTWIRQPTGTFLFSVHDGAEAKRPIFPKDDKSYSLHGYFISAEQAAYRPDEDEVHSFIKLDCSRPGVAITWDVTREIFWQKANDADLCLWNVDPAAVPLHPAADKGISVRSFYATS